MARKKSKFDLAKIGMKAAGLGAGAVGATLADKIIPASLAAPLKSGIKIVVGAVLPELVKNEFVGHVGDGMLAVGVGELAGSVVPGLSGIGEDPYMNPYLSGFDDPYEPDSGIGGPESGIGGLE